jgi:hypothetical protein
LIQMKSLTALALAIAFFCVSAFLLPTSVVSPPSPSKVGVKKGYWIEYSMLITGSPQLDTARNLTGYRTEVLETSDISIKVNKTATSLNGTYTSSIWNFSFPEGRVPGWAFIPANLSVGDTFFDFNVTANVAVEGEEQKPILGTRRTITHANLQGTVYKEWDKATGVYVYAVEHTTNYTVTTTVIATNMWGSKAQEQNPASLTLFIEFGIVGVIVFTVLPLVLGRKKLVKKV